MHVTRVMKGLNSDTAIYFLLTSYVEAIRSSSCTWPVSDSVLQLPLLGRSDIEERCRLLQRRTQTMGRFSTAQQRAQLKEALDVFACAVERLQALGGSVPRGAAAELCPASSAPSNVEPTLRKGP